MNTKEPDDLIIHKRQDLYPGISLKEAVARHLSAYGPAAVGPCAFDIALALCAHQDSVQEALDTLKAEGKARSLRPDPHGQDRWERIPFSGPPWRAAEQ